MGNTSVDASWSHLYPPFAEKLRKVLEETSKATGCKWVMTEGYRSQERQTWLYAQGRTRPGQVVTWLKVPKNHGAGIAADCYPTRNGTTPDFGIGIAVYEEYRDIYHRHGLSNPAWGKGDLGHVEAPALRVPGAAWVKAGFPKGETRERTVIVKDRALTAGEFRVDEKGDTWVKVSALKSLAAVTWDAKSETVKIG